MFITNQIKRVQISYFESQGRLSNSIKFRYESVSIKRLLKFVSVPFVGNYSINNTSFIHTSTFSKLVFKKKRLTLWHAYYMLLIIDYRIIIKHSHHFWVSRQILWKLNIKSSHKILIILLPNKASQNLKLDGILCFLKLFSMFFVKYMSGLCFHEYLHRLGWILKFIIFFTLVSHNLQTIELNFENVRLGGWFKILNSHEDSIKGILKTSSIIC